MHASATKELEKRTPKNGVPWDRKDKFLAKIGFEAQSDAHQNAIDRNLGLIDKLIEGKCNEHEKREAQTLVGGTHRMPKTGTVMSLEQEYYKLIMDARAVRGSRRKERQGIRAQRLTKRLEKRVRTENREALKSHPGQLYRCPKWQQDIGEKELRALEQQVITPEQMDLMSPYLLKGFKHREEMGQ